MDSEEIPVGCSIKVLPPDMVIPAARAAIEEDARNAPAIQQMATVAAGDQSDVVTPFFIAALTTKYFGKQTRVLPTFFVDNPSQATRRLILEHLNIWDCGIVFRETGDVGESRIRIGRGPHGHYSYLGVDNYMIPQNQVTMNLQGFTEATPASEYMRVVTHEGGHALAFPHEHMFRAVIERLNREAVIRDFMAKQGWSRAEVEAQVFTPLEEASIMRVAGIPIADETSIMCYRFEGYLTLDGRPIPGGMRPNASDLAFARTIYPKATGGGDPTPIDPPPPPVDPGIPRLTRGRWSKVYQYVPVKGPTRFVLTATPGEAIVIEFAGDGVWVAELLPRGAGAAPLKLKALKAKGENQIYLAAPGTEAEYYLTVRHKNARRPGPFRVRYS